MLYLVGTPIGNLGDISPRACEILSSVDLVACEDTRRTGLLLSNLNISNKLFSYHEHNKAAKGKVLIGMLKDGMDIALVSDAGMPSVSDPGEDLVSLCIAEDIPVSVVPGPVAAITALVLSGLDTRRYHFEGFLPSENKPRKERLLKLRSIEETIVLYEAPHRLMKLIEELDANGFGECRASFCRELTKKYEEVIRLRVKEASGYFTEKPPKGEFVVCLEALGMKAEEKIGLSEEEIDKMILDLSKEGHSTKEIAAIVAEKTQRSKKELYNYAVNLLK